MPFEPLEVMDEGPYPAPPTPAGHRTVIHVLLARLYNRFRTVDPAKLATLGDDGILTEAQRPPGGGTHPDLATHAAMGLATNADVSTALAGKQPLNSNLTAIAALATTTFGRALLALADSAALRAVIGTGTDPATFLRRDGTWATPAGGGGGGDSSMIKIETPTLTGATYTPTVTDRSGREHHFVEQSVTPCAFVTPSAATKGEFQAEVRCPDGDEVMTFPSNTLAMSDLNPPLPEAGAVRTYSFYTRGDVNAGDGYWRVSCAVSATAEPSLWVPANLGTGLWFEFDPDTFGLADGTGINAVAGRNHLGAAAITTSQPTVGFRPTLETSVANGHSVMRFVAASTHRLNLNADPVAVIGAAGMSVYVVIARTATHGGTTGDNRAVFEFGEGAGWGGGTFDPGRTNYVHRLGTGQVNNNVTTTYPDQGPGFRVVGLNKRVSDGVEEVRINRQTVHTVGGKSAALAGWTAGGSMGTGLFTPNFLDGDVAYFVWTKRELTLTERDQLENFLHARFAVA